MSFSSSPGNSAVISISLSVSLRSMLGIISRAGKPEKPREKPSNKRSISCCSAEKGLDMGCVTPRSLPMGIRDFNVMGWSSYGSPRLSHDGSHITLDACRGSFAEVHFNGGQKSVSLADIL